MSTAARDTEIRSAKPAAPQRVSILIGLACMLLAFSWQWLTVHFNYQGNWTALFCTGAKLRQPPELSGEHIYLFAGSDGYDGEMYHYVAHDPFFVRGFDTYLDAPRMRYRRILVPIAAHALALGRDELVDSAYIGVILLGVFLGGYFLSRYSVMLGYSARWGLLFLLIPATLVSIDRLTVDVALAAVCVAFALFVARGQPVVVYGTLVLAGLIRETGLLLIAGYVIWLLFERKFRRAVLFLTAFAPALGWYLFVEINTDGDTFSVISRLPFQGMAERLLTPYPYPFAVWINAVSTVLDYAALAGILVAVALAVRMAWRREWGPAEACVYLFALLAIFLYAPAGWEEVYAFGRTLSPLLVLLGLVALARRSWAYALPLGLVVPRIAIQFAPQAGGVLRHLI